MGQSREGLKGSLCDYSCAKCCDQTKPVAFSVLQQAKEMVMELIRDQGFREQRGEYGSRMGGGGGGGGDSLDVSVRW